MGIITGTLFASLVAWWYKSQEKIEDFDTILRKEQDLDKAQAELEGLLKKSLHAKKFDLHCQIASQVALVQAMQQKFDDAYATLHRAEKFLVDKNGIAQIRINYERGRVMYQEDLWIDGKVVRFHEIYALFYKAYALSEKLHYDYYTVDLAHMIAIIVPDNLQKIIWNNVALDIAVKTEDKKTKLWLGPLYNNLGQNYFDVADYEASLQAYQEAYDIFVAQKEVSQVQFASWTIARCLRVLGKVDEALAMQQQNLQILEVAFKNKSLNVAESTFYLMRGLIYEEFAWLYYVQNNHDQTRLYASRALQNLEQDSMFVKTSSERLEKLRSLLSN